MTRNDIYLLIDAERDYQEQCFAIGRWKEMAKCPAEFLNDIRYYTRQAGAVLTETGDDRKCMGEIRKIAALCVAAMEKNDTPPR